MASRRYQAAQPQAGMSFGALGLLIGLPVALMWMTYEFLKWLGKGFIALCLIEMSPAARNKDSGDQSVMDQNTVPERNVSPVANRTIQHTVGEDAKVHCRLYADRQQIDVIVISLSDRAKERFGRRKMLATLDATKHSLKEAVQYAEQQVKALLEGEAPPETILVEGPESAGEQTTEPVDNAAGTQFSGDKTEPRPTHTVKVRKAARTKGVRYRGALVSAGVRTHTSGKYDTFGVTLDDEALGATQDLWGVDLERALAESGARIGDCIELGVVGTTPTSVRGKPAIKNIWSVEKL